MKRCKTCNSRNKKGYCTSKKLDVDIYFPEEEKQDMLLYDYAEGGGFWVGPKFGCVHHTARD